MFTLGKRCVVGFPNGECMFYNFSKSGIEYQSQVIWILKFRFNVGIEEGNTQVEVGLQVLILKSKSLTHIYSFQQMIITWGYMSCLPIY